MTARRIMPLCLSFVVVLGACQGTERAAEETTQAAGDVATSVAQRYPAITAPTVFENDRVVAQKIVTEPGKWAGEHSHTGNQLAVVIKGGTVTYREGGTDRDVTYKDGQVYWVDAVETHDHSAKGAPVEVVLITMKPTAAGGMAAARQEYPNATANVVFEDSHVIVQRLVGEPGKWAGEHSHAGGQIAVVLKGGTTVFRAGGEERHETRQAGEVFAVEPTQAHDHSTMSETPTQVMLITPKM